MTPEPPLILIIGAADTGRAPMAAALLRRLLRARGLDWRVASAGVVGHDDEPAQTEARDAIALLNLDLSQHQARSLSAELAATAEILLAIDNGVARVLHAHYPEATIVSLGELAGRRRDIPDPFRMQVGAWVSYAREIEAMLSAGLDRLAGMVAGQPAAADTQPTDEPAAPATAVPAAVAPVAPPGGAPRQAAIERCARVLGLLIDMPDVVDWGAASRQISADLSALAAPLGPQDLAQPYVAVLRVMLDLSKAPPTPGQAACLREAISALRSEVGGDDLAALSAHLAGYSAL